MQEHTTTIVPYLCCRNAAEAYEFYQRAFDAQPEGLMNSPDGKVMHASLSIDGAPVYLCDEYPDMGSRSPLTLGGTPFMVHMQVADCDAVFDRAVAAGCTVAMPMEDQFWGDRFGMVVCPYGHQWSIATTKQRLTFDEVRAAMAKG